MRFSEGKSLRETRLPRGNRIYSLLSAERVDSQLVAVQIAGVGGESVRSPSEIEKLLPHKWATA